MLSWIDNFLNRITMYRLVLYVLAGLLLIAAAFGAVGWLPYSPVDIIFSTAVIFFAAWATNGLFAGIFGVEPSKESSWITALILALIITPVAPAGAGAAGAMFLVWAAVLAIASKYVLAINKKHVFNPAAFAVALTALAMGQSASWWVGGNIPLLPFVLIGGFLVVRKVQRFDLVLAFLAAAFASIIAANAGFESPLTAVEQAIIHAPLFYFAAIMLTEPATTPPTRPGRIAYGVLVGLLFAPAVHLGSVYSTPELALLAGNVFSWLVSPKSRYIFALKKKEEVGAGIYDFTFAPRRKIKFRPGQYMEWTLATKKGDDRGNRRYFTLASSPTESSVRLGVRFYDKSSAFKKALLAMEPGDRISAAGLAGDFTLPKDRRKKIAFIAGGIGITPFRSMAKYLSDRGERRDVILLYSNRSAREIAYREVFDEAARKIGMRTIYAVTGAAEANGTANDDAVTLPPNAHLGRVNARFIASAIPNWNERLFYISGSQAMVDSFVKTLTELGVPKRHIKTDFFPGFA